MDLPALNTLVQFIAALADLVTIVGGVVAIVITAWQLRIYSHLKDNEKKIKAKQQEIDAIPNKAISKVSNALVTQAQLDKIISNKQKPLELELKHLERNRKFILDKLLFAKKNG